MTYYVITKVFMGMFFYPADEISTSLVEMYFVQRPFVVWSEDQRGQHAKKSAFQNIVHASA